MGQFIIHLFFVNEKNIVLELAGTAEMPVVYNADLVKAITKELHDVLSENDVEEPIVKFLVENKIVKLRAFADLADSKANIVEVVGRPAGLDPADNIKSQPLNQRGAKRKPRQRQPSKRRHEVKTSRKNSR